MYALAATLDAETFGRLITGLAEAALDHASEPVPTLVERLRQFERQARTDGLSAEAIGAIVGGRRLLGDRSDLLAW